MGQKVTPTGLRFGINKEWISRWNATSNQEMAKWLIEDEKVRLYFIKEHKRAGIERVEIERLNDKRIHKFFAYVYVAQPGLLLGKEKTLEKIELVIHKIVGRKTEVKVIIKASPNPGVSARLIAREIADGIENRISFRSAQKMGIKKALAAGAKGIKTKVAGRLGGAEIARDEGYSEGIVPLSTLRADIDYALELARTTYGVIGVKVWINRGLYFGKGFMPLPEVVRSRSLFDRHQNNDRRDRSRNLRQRNKRDHNFAQFHKPSESNHQERKPLVHANELNHQVHQSEKLRDPNKPNVDKVESN